MVATTMSVLANRYSRSPSNTEIIATIIFVNYMMEHLDGIVQFYGTKLTISGSV